MTHDADVFGLWQNDERMHHYQRRRASITGLMVELRKIIETGRLVVVVMTRLVCAQHGHVVNGVQVPCRNTKHENEHTTIRSQLGKGNRSEEGRL